MDGPPERGAPRGPTVAALPTSRAGSVLALLALAVAIVFLGFMLAATNGHFVPQVVDLYVVCQYARSFAEGHPFHYNAGEPASTGSTSLLLRALLGAAHARAGAALAARPGRGRGPPPLPRRDRLLARHLYGGQVLVRQLRDRRRAGPGHRVRRRRGARPPLRLLSLADADRPVPWLGAL